MRLPRRVQVLLASFLALIVVAFGVDVVVLRARDAASDRVQDTLDPALLQLQSLLTSLVDQETAERGFLLTGDESFLEPYDAGRAVVADGLERVRVLLDGRESLLAATDRIRSRISAWQDLGADFEIAAKREGRDQVVTSLVAAGTGTRLFEAVRTEIRELSAELREDVDDERARLDRLDGILVAVDVVTLLAALVLLLVTAVLSRRWVTRPLRTLGRSVREVADGSLGSTVTAEGPPEFTELAGNVDAMRRRILAEVEEAERAREALADRGMVVLTLREELAAGPTRLPDGVALAGRFLPAQGIVAGDWFDVVRLDDERVAVALVDVSGHGAGVGAFALRTKALTLAAIESHDPGDALGWVADRLGDTGEQFLTGVIFVLHVPSGVVRYASAGHPPLLLAGLTGITHLGPTGPLLGPVGGRWSTEQVDLARGGALVAFSDGLIEARDGEGEPFGLSRLADVIDGTQLGGPDAIADACLDAVQQHQIAREDDLTLVVLSR
ncbi:MAG TPA: SpoIIE family protein phosphatase [Acidimicrobiales bacterium]|nr:SpoIIE family protein phosphatase [Acidimicrobiales bacterium]